MSQEIQDWKELVAEHMKEEGWNPQRKLSPRASTLIQAFFYHNLDDYMRPVAGLPHEDTPKELKREIGMRIHPWEEE